MHAVRSPGASSQHMESRRGENGLKPELRAATGARVSQVTDPHRVRDRPLKSRTRGGALPKRRGFLTDAGLIESLVACFIRSEDEHVCRHGGPWGVTRASAAPSQGKTHAQARRSMSIRDLTPISAEVPSRTGRLVDLPIHRNVPVITTPSCW